jgi:hypothetical protein
VLDKGFGGVGVAFAAGIFKLKMLGGLFGWIQLAIAIKLAIAVCDRLN